MTASVLFIVIDQLRADVLRGALADAVPTPNLDRFAEQSAVFTNHFTVTAPCGPARASLLTGLYARNHGAVRNGTPLRSGHTNLALEVRKLGYEPLLFGYTDSQPDPATRHPNDPDLKIYENVMPGFREITEMRLEAGFEYPAWLKALGYDIHLPLERGRLELARPRNGKLGGAALYAAEHSDTAYLTDEVIKALAVRPEGWFAHVTYIRPHPPWVAPAPYNSLIDPQAIPPPATGRPAHPLLDAWFSEPSHHDMFWGFDGRSEYLSRDQIALCRATYLGLVAEVDQHFGRLMAFLDETGQTRNTLVVVTADHGEMLGDKGMWGKDSIFDPVFHIPLMIRDPNQARPLVVDALTESVDVMPTILERLGATDKAAGDGQSLVPLLSHATPSKWRDSVHIEIEFGDPRSPTRFQRALDLPAEALHATITRTRSRKWVRFMTDLPDISFDLDNNPLETLSGAGPAVPT